MVAFFSRSSEAPEREGMPRSTIGEIKHLKVKTIDLVLPFKLSLYSSLCGSFFPFVMSVSPAVVEMTMMSRVAIWWQ